MQIPAILSYALGVASGLRYFFVFLGTVIEGPIVMVVSGFFYRFGAFSLIPLYLCLVAGDLVADVFWYYVGSHFADPFLRRFGKFFGLTPEIIEKMKALIRKHDKVVLLGSKLTAGFGLALAIVIAAGASGVPFKKYMALNAIGEFVVAAILLAVGFYFGQAYTYINDSFKAAFVIGTVAVVAAIIFGFSRYIRGKAEKGAI